MSSDNQHLHYDEVLLLRLEKLCDQVTKGLQARQRENLLPTLTGVQTQLVVDMVACAYYMGALDTLSDEMRREEFAARERSLRGVEKRRENSQRHDIVKAFEEAAAEGRDVSADELARDHNVSRSTAYRALQMLRAGRLPW